MEEKRTDGPLVSVVINNYNYGRFVKDAIESALGQTYPRTEVIVVDDGSTDNSREVIAGYRGRVRAIFKENGGQGSAFNAGFAASKGEIVIFLDADDLLLPQAVEEIVSVWRPGLSKVQWRLQRVTGDLQPLPGTWPEEPSMPSGDLRERVLRWGYYPSPTTSGNAFARWLLERILPMPESEWRMGADAYLIALAPLYGEVKSIDKVLGYYRIHGNNHSSYISQDVEANTKKLLELFVALRATQDLLKRIARDQGLRTNPKPTPFFVKSEMTLALLLPSPSQTPGLDPNRLRIALRGIYAAATHPSMPSLWSRLRLAAWFLFTAILPRNMAKKLVILGAFPGSRPKWLATLLRAAHPSLLQGPHRAVGGGKG